MIDSVVSFLGSQVYTYARISKIRADLIALISKLKANPEYRNISADPEFLQFEEAIKDYDMILKIIGINGSCVDEDMIRGFAITEEWIAKIKI